MPIFRLQQLFLSQNKFLNYLNRFHLLTVPMPQCNCWRSRFLKLQCPASNKFKRQLFGILNFGHCDLFGIGVLLFEIFYLLKPEHRNLKP